MCLNTRGINLSWIADLLNIYTFNSTNVGSFILY